MKKILIATLGCFLFFTSFASDGYVSKNAKNNFAHLFENATNVKWEGTADFYRASFYTDDDFRQAYFNLNGDYIGLSKTVKLKDLSSKISKKLLSDYEGYMVRELASFETAEGDFNYFAVVENEKEKVTVKITIDGGFSVVKRTKK